MIKKLSILAVLISLFSLAAAPGVGANTAAETAAVAYVTAFQKGNWAEAKMLASDVALSFVEFVEAKKGSSDGFKSIEKVESVQTGDSIRVKVYYVNASGRLVPRYVKVRSISVGKNAVVDDRLVGSDWISNSYTKAFFKKPETIDGVTVAIQGFLTIGDEIKYDLTVTNASKLDRYIMPMQESYCVVEIDGAFKKRYYSIVPEVVTDGVIKAGDTVRSFAIMPFWQKDPSIAGLKVEAVSWIFFLPFGPLEQFALEYM